MIALGIDVKILVLTTFLMVCIGYDLKTYRIPNPWILFGFALSWAMLYPNLSGPDLLAYVKGMLIPFALCWFIYRIRGIGAGDIKLFMIIGCFHGSREAMYTMALSFLFGAGISISKLLIHKELLCSMQRSLLFFQDRLREGKLEPYVPMEGAFHRIHFSIPILLGYITWMGVKGWQAVPFY